MSQGLFVGDVAMTRRGGLRVELHDGVARVATVTWRRSSELEARAMQLRAWLRNQTPVTYVRRGSEVVLVDEEQLLARALGD